MKRKSFKLITSLLVSLNLAGFLSGCGSNNSAMEIKVNKAKDGYYITLSKDGHSYTTNGGSLGVRFDKNEFRADDPIYVNYDSASKAEGGILATGKIESEWGSIISFTDFFEIVNETLRVRRSFKVEEVGEEYGFSVEQKWIENEEAKIYEKEWFVPGCFDVNGARDFSKVGSRLYYDGSSFVVPAEDVSVLQASSLGNNYSFTILDTTSGYREVPEIESQVGESSYCHISEVYNMPGLLMSDSEDGHICYAHIYPTFTNKAKDKFIYRQLPLVKGLSRQISYEITLSSFSSYNEMKQTKWRDAFNRISYTDKRYKLNDVYDTLINYIDRSYSESNIWGNIPQYMTTLDHYFPDSGFLYRNMEFATIMYKYGYETHNEDMMAKAVKVGTYQIVNDSLDTGIKAYVFGNAVYNRVRYEGLSAAVEAYNLLKTTGYSDTNAVEALHKYIVKKAALYADDTSPMASIFYGTLALYKDILHVDYTATFKRLLDGIAESTKNYHGFYGAIEYTDEFISVMEDYMVFLRAFINGYLTTYSQVYLDEAKRIATHLESFFQLQGINLNLIGSTGQEGCHLGFIGNERFLAHGYAFNNTSHGTLDISTNASLADFYRLYEITGDKHFLDFADARLYNSFLYINMGDKIGHLDDPEHSSGTGFMNEFSGNATNAGYKSVDIGVRGAVHDSNIGWNVFHVIMPLGYLRDTGYANFSKTEDLSHDLAVNKVISVDEDNIAHSVYNVTDKNDSTYYVSDKNSEFVIDLFEQCEISKINVIGNASIKLSSDNVNFSDVTTLDSVNAKGRFVKVCVNANEKVNTLSVIGVPVLYQDMTVGSTIVSGNESAALALDSMNYETSWTIAKADAPQTLVIDLGQECEIYETALKFKEIGSVKYSIELSNDNSSFSTYVIDDGTVSRYVHVAEKFAKARYVKLTIEDFSFTSARLQDFKILGSK